MQEPLSLENIELIMQILYVLVQKSNRVQFEIAEMQGELIFEKILMASS